MHLLQVSEEYYCHVHVPRLSIDDNRFTTLIGFLTAYYRYGWDLADSMRMGCAAGGYRVSIVSGSDDAPSWDTLKQWALTHQLRDSSSSSSWSTSTSTSHPIPT